LIYFVQDKSTRKRLIKIGYTQNMDSRITGLQTGAAESLVVLGVMDGDRKEEKRLHSQFKPFRVAGEWFSPDASLLAFIKANTRSWDKGSMKKIWISGGMHDKLNIIALFTGMTHGEVVDELFGDIAARRYRELLLAEYEARTGKSLSDV